VDHHADTRAHNRRDILKGLAIGGIGTMLSMTITGCSDEVTDPTAHATFNFSSDKGAMNLVYVYTQFMDEFYTRLMRDQYVGMTTNEYGRLTTIGYQKEMQRNAFELLISAPKNSVVLVNFEPLDFSRRDTVMGFAQTFEDLGVAMLAGTARSLSDARNLTFVSQIRSVWARHAALIRDLNDIAAGVSRTGFVGTVDANGLDQTTTADAVLTLIRPYFRTTLSITGAA